MKSFLPQALLLLLLVTLIGCKKNAPEKEDAPEATQEQSADADAAADADPDAPIDRTPLKAAFEAELLQSFEGALMPGSERRAEDKSPVEHHEIDLEEGDNIYVEMQATDQFRTYLLIGTPDQSGGPQNDECYPGQGLSSCIRFQAKQTGTYLVMANSASARSFGKYTINVYKETEEQAKANAEAHAIVAKESQKRLEKHLQQKRAERAEKLERRKAQEALAAKKAAEAAAETDADADAAEDAEADAADKAPSTDITDANDHAADADNANENDAPDVD